MTKEEVKVWWAVAVIVFSLASCNIIKIREHHKTCREAMEKGYEYTAGGFNIEFKDEEE